MNTLKKYWWIPVGLLILAVVIAAIQHEKSKTAIQDPENITYNLPIGNITTVGPKYWFALHDVTARIPCSICSNEASSFMRFFHDYVNKKIGKPILDQANYDEWVAKIDAQSKQPAMTQSSLAS